MPPKLNVDDPEAIARNTLFKSIGLSDAKSLEVARSSKQATVLSSLIDRANLRERKEAGELDEKKLALLLSLCVACATSAKLDERSKLYALEAILSGRLKSNEQISGALACFYHPSLSLRVRLRRFFLTAIVQPQLNIWKQILRQSTRIGSIMRVESVRNTRLVQKCKTSECDLKVLNFLPRKHTRFSSHWSPCRGSRAGQPFRVQ